MPGIFFLGPQPTFADPNEQIVGSSVTITSNSSATVTGYGSAQVALIVNITAAPTGTTPTLTFTMTEVDPIDQVTRVGGSVSSGALTGVFAGTFTLPVVGAGTFVVAWTITGTTPSFTGVNVSVAGLGNPQPSSAGTGRSSIVNPSSVQTANYTNNTAPSTATLSNTVPSYSTLGGLWQFNAVTGAETDYALFGYQVPSGSNLYLRSVVVGAYVFGNTSSAKATILQWAIAANSSGASLATGGSNPPEFLPIGMMDAPQSARVGDAFNSSPINFQPATPIVVLAARYLHIVLRIPVANATPGQQVRGFCMVDAYFE